MARLLRRLVVFGFALALVGGCATQGDDAVDENGEFTFVSPGGQTRLFYSPDERGRVSGLEGESLMRPGEQISLDDFDDQVVVLNVWGSWCGPCRAESDDLQKVQDQTRDQGVQFLGIDVRDQRSAAQDFHDNHDISYPSLFDPSGRSLLALDNFPRSTVPATIVLDRQHRVAGIFLTQVRDEELLPHVERVAAEQPRA